MRTRSLALATAILLVLFGAGCGEGGSSGTGPGASPAAQSPDAAVAGDIAFARSMIPHHEQAIEMSELALRRSDASAEVKDLADQIQNGQGPEIEVMTRWLDAWGATATPAPGHGAHAMPGMMSDHDMAALRDATGTAFDRRWLAMMVAHHEGAIAAARDVLATTRNPEVESLATDVIASQQEEIRAMTGMLGTARPTSTSSTSRAPTTTA